MFNLKIKCIFAAKIEFKHNKAMTEKEYKCNLTEFSNLLHTDKDNIHTLDLSNYNLIECIEKMCEIKSASHPKMRKNYSMAICQIKRIEKDFNCTVHPIIINSLFWTMFIQYLVDLGLKYSSITTVKSQILSSLNWASKYSVKLSPSYNEVDVPKYSPIKIALTPDDISHIYHFNLNSVNKYSKKKQRQSFISKNKIETLTRVKDMFVLSCNLGQRYSDMVRIDSTCFKNGSFSIVQQKTGNRCKVDIETMSIDKRTTYEILTKYNYKAPYTGDICNYNKYIKELLTLIGGTFLEDLKCENKLAGIIIPEIVKKYKLISSHTARRTFATINTLKNIPRQKILRATGHSTETSFIKYICYEDEA